ncbi:MAG: hypothetical protein ACRDSJ_17235 [Rubrobacteraceae bacterium]
MDGGSEVCLEQRVEKLWDSGMSVEEISAEMGVDEGWVETLIRTWSGGEERGRD